MADWIDTFLEYSSALPSPEIFRRWAGITAISGALDRRVWADAGLGPVYPNLYTFLVGPPGTGKSQAISPVKNFWLRTKNLHVAPDNVTKAALVDTLHRNSRFLIRDDVPLGMLEIHSVLVASPELGVLLSRHDLDFLSVLNQIFDSPDNYREERRSMEGRQPDITNPQLTILAGTQPDFLATMLPEEAWGMGFCSRLMLIYASEPPVLELFNGTKILQDDVSKELCSRLESMSELYGEMGWSKAAKDSLILWHKHGLLPVPEHSKLTHYVPRRLLQALKLITISAISRCGELKIIESDVKRTKDWMKEAEAVMPDIFRAMLARSDSEIIQDLHYHVWKIWASVVIEKRVPVSEERIYEFLKDRLPSEKIGKIIEIAEKSGCLRSFPGGGWIPRPIIQPNTGAT